MTITLSAALFYAGQRQAASVSLIREGMVVAARVRVRQPRPGVAHDRLAAFFAGARQVVSAKTAAAHHTEAVADRHPSLRGDPLSPDVVALVELIRPEPVVRGPWGGA